MALKSHTGRDHGPGYQPMWSSACRKGVEIREADDEIVLACVTLERPGFPLGHHDVVAA